MKAIIQTDYTGISGLQIVERPAPKLTPMTALIQTKFTPVLPYDILTEEGKLKNIRPVNLPITVGYGFTGIVTAVGSLRSSSLVGQAVLGVSPSGAAQEIIANNIPPILFKIPDNVGLDEASTIIGGADAALMATNELKVNANDTVLVTGSSGGVGTYLIQLLRLRGAHIIAMTSPGNIGFVRQLGADEIVDYTAPLEPQLINISHPTKIVDTVGSINLLNVLSSQLGSYEMLSLSTQLFPDGKPGQSFRFSNNSIGLHGYNELLNMLSSCTLKAHVHVALQFEQVTKAHDIVANGHVQGRVLLAY